MKPFRKILSTALVSILVLTMPAWSHPSGPLGTDSHEWHPDPAIKSTTSLNFDFHAGDNFVSWSSAARLETRQGKECLVGPYLLFDIDEKFASNTDEDFLLDLTFYRPDTDGFILSYDQAIKPTAMQVRFAEDTKNKIWHTETVRLERARFADRKYYGMDLSIGGIGSQLTHPEGSGEAVLCDVKIHREGPAPTPLKKGLLSLHIIDETGKNTQARIGLYKADGWAPLAGDDAIPVQRYTEDVKELPMLSVPSGWHESGRYVFFANGLYEDEIPAGEYQAYVMKGPEYRILKQTITIKAGEKQSVTLALKRHDNLTAKGWISGDDHIHIGRPSPEKNENILNFMKAEDLHVANLLIASNLRETYFDQYDYGEAGTYSQDQYSLVPGQESPRTSHRGHTIGLNPKKFHKPIKEYFVYDDTPDRLHKEGGLWGYAHVGIDAFNLYNGLALDVPRGKVDFLEMLQYGMMNTSYMYDYLNMGFKLVPSAGSDYPYIDFPGSERLYVQFDQDKSAKPATAQSWFTGMKSGRSFVTNWMSVDFSVNGDKKAVEYNIKSGEAITIEALLKVNPDFDKIDRLELVAHGNILAAMSTKENASELNFSHSFAPKETMWIAIRGYGKAGALLHTTPIYIYVDGNKDFSNPNTIVELAEKHRDILVKFKASTPSLDVEFERPSVEDLIQPKWEESKVLLDAAIDEAIAIYTSLINKNSD